MKIQDFKKAFENLAYDTEIFLANPKGNIPITAIGIGTKDGKDTIIIYTDKFVAF